MRCDYPYLAFTESGVSLAPDINFLPKVPSQFHLNLEVCLPTFFPNPSSDEERRLHSLDVRRALLFYLKRSKAFRRDQQLFVSYTSPRLGSRISSQRFSKWLTETIKTCYLLAKRPLPGPVRGHSTRAMATSVAFLKGVSLADVCGAFQPVPVQPPQASFPEGATAVLPCRLEQGHIQDYHVLWFRQQPAERPAHVLKHRLDGQIERTSGFDERFAPVRDAAANSYLLHVQELRTEDSATYWCMAEIDSFSVAVSGAGTQLSVTGGESTREPAKVILLSDAAAHLSESPDLHALCLAEQFYPGFVEITWSMSGNTVVEGVTPGEVILNDDGSYSASSVLTIPRQLLGKNASLKCSVHHYSSGSKAERSLKLC
ncbi:immunoglobulin gamma-1 heavy chain-like [Heteronotia binoei]|uniref:immunoglobulin gamma-1 heavy chain-like n=1 Tax=Heteronotia binoei TaxID=13085 RepID=UPI0029314171|nr:immunoglobulin gamma-1 heavy chain-like [Heteronotia binoei]